jgi:hypothetical protein
LRLSRRSDQVGSGRIDPAGVTKPLNDLKEHTANNIGRAPTLRKAFSCECANTVKGRVCLKQPVVRTPHAEPRSG